MNSNRRIARRRIKRMAKALADQNDLYVSKFVCNRNARPSFRRAIVRYEFRWEYLPSQTHIGFRAGLTGLEPITPERRAEINLTIYAYVAEGGAFYGDNMATLKRLWRWRKHMDRHIEETYHGA